jgi:heptosyltransferase III
MIQPSPRRILVVRRDNIGDLICTTPLLHTLRQAMPDAHIAVLVNSYNGAVLLGNPDVNEVFSYDKLKHRTGLIGKISAVFARIGLLMKMRMRSFDLAILAKSNFDPHGLRMARWAGAPRILGVAPNRGESAPGLTHPFTAENTETSHEVEVVAQLGQALGIKEKPGKMLLFPDAALKAAFRQRLENHEGVKQWVALHISAREKTRQWPAEKFIALIERIRRRNADAQIGFVLFWSPGAANKPTHPGDDDKAAEILRNTGESPVEAFNTARLEELIAGISVCDAFIGSDGGAMHVAVGLDLPIIALFETSEGKRLHWYPWKVPHRLLQPTTFAVEDIEVEAVASATEELLLVS